MTAHPTISYTQQPSVASGTEQWLKDTVGVSGSLGTQQGYNGRPGKGHDRETVLQESLMVGDNRWSEGSDIFVKTQGKSNVKSLDDFSI